MGAGPLLVCAECRDEIQSMHHHDFVTCGCGKTSVVGGSAYTKVMFAGKPPLSSWEAKQIMAMEAEHDG